MSQAGSERAHWATTLLPVDVSIGRSPPIVRASDSLVDLGSHNTNRSAVNAGPEVDLDGGDQLRVALRRQT